MQMYTQAGGQISEQTLMSLVSFIDDPQQEKERIESEMDEKIKRADEREYNVTGDESLNSDNIDENTDEKQE